MKKLLLTLFPLLGFSFFSAAQLTCATDTCPAYGNYFIHTGTPDITTVQQAADSGYFYEIDESTLPARICFAFKQPGPTDWTSLKIFFEYLNCSGNTSIGMVNVVNGSSVSSTSQNGWSTSASTIGGCGKVTLTGNPTGSNPGIEVTTLGTFKKPSCAQEDPAIMFGTTSCGLDLDSVYHHCFQMNPSGCGRVRVMPILNCQNCTPAVVCDTIEYEVVSQLNATCAGNNADGAVSLGICTNKDIFVRWNDGDTNLFRNNLSPGIYEITVTDSSALAGCPSDTTFQLVIEGQECDTLVPWIVVPNIFTPNGDGVNDVFKVRHEGLQTLNIKIYNRWGTYLGEITEPNGSWDGKNHSEGTYFYLLKATDVYEKEYDMSGPFMLQR